MIKALSLLSKNKTSLKYNFLDSFDDNFLINTRFEPTACFQFQGISTGYIDDEKYQISLGKMIDSLGTVPEGVAISFVKTNRKEYRNILENHKKQLRTDIPFLNERNTAMLKHIDRKARAIEQFMFISAPSTPSKNLDHTNLFSKLFSDRLTMPSISLYESKKDLINKTVDKFNASLCDNDFKIKEMSKNEILNYCYYHLNHINSDIEIIDDVYTVLKNNKGISCKKTIREQVSKSPIDTIPSKEYFKIGSKFVSVFYIEMLGVMSDLNFYDELAKDLTIDHEYMVTVQGISEKEIETIFKKNKNNEAIFSRMPQGLKGDIQQNADDSEKSNQQTFPIGTYQAIISDQISYIADNNLFNLKSLKFSIAFTLKSENLSEIENGIDLIKQRLASNKFYNHSITQNKELMTYNYHAFLPGHTHLNFDFIYNNTLTALYYLPIFEEEKGFDLFDDTKPTNQIFLNHKNEIVKFHSWYYANVRHGQIIATTGSGKTFFLNNRQLNILSEIIRKNEPNRKIIAIEPKQGFERLCELLDFPIIKYDTETPLNPFYPKKYMKPLSAKDTENSISDDLKSELENTKYEPMFLDFYVSLIEHLVTDHKIPSLSPRIKKVIIRSISDLYDDGDDDYFPILDEIVDKFKSFEADNDSYKEEIDHIRQNLELWCDDQYKNLFNVRKQLNVVDSEYVYFDLGSLQNNEQLNTTAMYAIWFTIARLCFTGNCFVYIDADEANIMYQSEIGAKLVDFIRRLGRSYDLALTLATQNVKDAEKSPLLKGSHEDYLTMNTCLYVKSQANALENVEIFNYKEVETVDKLEKVPGEFSDAYIQLGDKKIRIRFSPDSYTYWTATSDKQDRRMIQSYEKNHSDLSKAKIISKLVKDFPNGALK